MACQRYACDAEMTSDSFSANIFPLILSFSCEEKKPRFQAWGFLLWPTKNVKSSDAEINRPCRSSVGYCGDGEGGEDLSTRDIHNCHRRTSRDSLRAAGQ